MVGAEDAGEAFSFSGIFVIPSDFWPLAACAKGGLLLLDHVATRYSVPYLFHTKRRRVLPSRAISPASCSA